ncbi:MAG TPA: threonine synthase [Salinimicrobium sp.]|nr:threonine synthase [Salinimicrobium sp.]
MKYYSLNDRSQSSDFGEAVIRGLAPDKGLYFPTEIPRLSRDFFESLSGMTREEVAFEVIKNYIGNEIPVVELNRVIESTLSFDFPVVSLEKKVDVLELFHGPTMAFKDVGAKFMAGCLSYFVKERGIGTMTVLVATSGDTGGAVANGFSGVDGIDVVILYPKGKVSGIQEKQLTTSGENVTALAVNGAFDKCQEMVKTAFLDNAITSRRKLTSANSINIARWLPQMFYYFFAWSRVKQKSKDLVFSVPSGNFGNICAGLLAAEMGLPVQHFLAANNSNDVVTRYLAGGVYRPAPSVETISNAMDVGDPSNFIRVLELFKNNDDLDNRLSSCSFNDDQTKEAIGKLYQKTRYIMDPHGAVGYLGLKKFLGNHPEYHGVFLETAHPVKFCDTVESLIGAPIEIPKSIKALHGKESKSIKINDYDDLKEFLMR